MLGGERYGEGAGTRTTFLSSRISGMGTKREAIAVTGRWFGSLNRGFAHAGQYAKRVGILLVPREILPTITGATYFRSCIPEMCRARFSERGVGRVAPAVDIAQIETAPRLVHDVTAPHRTIADVARV